MDPNLAIKEIMTTELVSVRPDQSAERIRHIFETYGFHHLPVVESGGKLVGIISKSDYHKIAYFLSINAIGKTRPSAEPSSICAKDFMTKYPLHLEPDDTAGLAADIFLANKFHALPVVEDGQLVGIVTSHDLLKYCFNTANEPSEDEVYDE